MKSEHDHWGELRALRKKMRRASNEATRAQLWGRYCRISWSLEGLLNRKAQTRCDRCGNKLGSGYGFAFGGGLGLYTFCTACSWYTKVPDHEGLPCSSA